MTGGERSEGEGRTNQLAEVEPEVDGGPGAREEIGVGCALTGGERSGGRTHSPRLNRSWTGDPGHATDSDRARAG